MKTETNYTREAAAIAGVVEKTAQSLHSTCKYIYAVSQADFYNINVKDLFKTSLSNITKPHILTNLGLSQDSLKNDKTSEFAGERYARAVNLFNYAFAVRIPYLRRRFDPRDLKERKIDDRFFAAAFVLCEKHGAADPEGFLPDENIKWAIKLSRTNEPEPPFNGEWFRRWVYSRDGELAAITNRNMFLLGCVDALLPLYYAKLCEVLEDMIPATPLSKKK